MSAATSVQRKHLALDPRVVADRGETRLLPGRVAKEPRNPLFVEDRPWEVRFDNLYANVLFDEEERLYKCWYNPFIVDEVTATTPPAARQVTPYRPGQREMGLCYATSADGIAWEKPALGIVEFEGATANNLVLRRCQGVGVWKDARDPDRRYKAFMQGGVATSPDGLHWSAVRPCPEIRAQGDTHNNALWDARAGRYVGITRLWDGGQRLVGRTESPDFRRWTAAVEVMREPLDAPHRQTYALLAFPYADVYLGLLMVLDTEDDTVDCELAWSPDTHHWARVCPGVPLLPRGAAGSFDSGCLYAAAYPILRDGRLRLYYGGGDAPHGGWRAGGFGLAYLRSDGFAGLEPASGVRAATVVTEPVVPAGRRLVVSADAAGGELRAGVLGCDDLALERCRPIATDVTDGVVQWDDGRHLAELVGRPIRLAFELRSARLYAFGFFD